MQGPCRSRCLQAKCAQRRPPASLLDLPDDLVDRVATTAGRPVRLVCRRLCAAVPLSRLRPQQPSTLPMDALLAAATKPTLLRPLTSLDLSQLTDHAHQAAHQDVVSRIAQEAAAHCNALAQLDLGWLSEFDLSLLTVPGTPLLHTLRSFTLLLREGLPNDLAPLSLLSSLDDLSLGLGRLRTSTNQDELLGTLRQLLGPVLSLTQLTALRLQASHRYSGLWALPQLLPIHFPRLRHLDLLWYAMEWDTTQCQHLAVLTSLTCLAVHHQWGINDLDVNDNHEEVGAAIGSTCRAFFLTVANLPLLHTLTLHLSEHDAVDALPALFHDAPPGAFPPSAAGTAPAPSLRSLSLQLEVQDYYELCWITQALHGSASALAHLSIDGGCDDGLGGAYANDPQGLQSLVTAAPALRSLSLGSIDCADTSALAPLAELASSLIALTLLYVGDIGDDEATILTCLTQLQKLNVDQYLEDDWADALAQLPGRVDVQVEPA